MIEFCLLEFLKAQFSVCLLTFDLCFLYSEYFFSRLLVIISVPHFHFLYEYVIVNKIRMVLLYLLK